MSARIEMAGMVVGRLTVLELAENDKRHRAQWLCQCSCGTTKVLGGIALRRKAILSCGCLRDEKIAAVRRTHRMTRSPEYHVFSGMVARCENKKNGRYHRYGGRGIKVCSRWRDNFEVFLADMGERPSSKHTIERLDNDGDYEPGNCVWATRKQNDRNTSTVKLNQALAADAKLVRNSGDNLSAWAREHGVSQATAWNAATGKTWGDGDAA